MDDKTILELYMERSEDAIKETEKAYGRYCHYIAYTILHSDEDAEEIVNDTLLKAWQVIPPAKARSAQGIFGADHPSAVHQPSGNLYRSKARRGTICPHP